jgi:hypothetical protein
MSQTCLPHLMLLSNKSINFRAAILNILYIESRQQPVLFCDGPPNIQHSIGNPLRNHQKYSSSQVLASSSSSSSSSSWVVCSVSFSLSSCFSILHFLALFIKLLKTVWQWPVVPLSISPQKWEASGWVVLAL